MMPGNLFSKTPKWAGCNTQSYPEPTKEKLVCYMQKIRLPGTRQDVMQKTLKRSQTVAKECEICSLLHMINMLLLHMN